MKKNEGDQVRNLKTHSHHNSNGSPTIITNLNSQSSSPNQRLNTSTSNKSPNRIPLFKNTIDPDLVDQFRLREKNEEQIRDIRKDPKVKRTETPRKERERESPTPSCE